MGRRSEHSREELHDLIVNAALSLIQERGAAAVTARQIAQSIGYTPGMLYAVFKNQFDIFLHVNLVTLDALQSHCQASGKDQPNPSKRLQLLGSAYWSFARDNTHQFNLLFTRHDAEAPAGLPERVRNLIDLVETALTELRPTADQASVRLAARALWAGVHGATEMGLSNLFFFALTENSTENLPENLAENPIENSANKPNEKPTIQNKPSQAADDQALQVIQEVVDQFVAGWLTKGTA